MCPPRFGYWSWSTILYTELLKFRRTLLVSHLWPVSAGRSGSINKNGDWHIHNHERCVAKESPTFLYFIIFFEEFMVENYFKLHKSSVSTRDEKVGPNMLGTITEKGLPGWPYVCAYVCVWWGVEWVVSEDIIQK